MKTAFINIQNTRFVKQSTNYLTYITLPLDAV